MTGALALIALPFAVAFSWSVGSLMADRRAARMGLTRAEPEACGCPVCDRFGALTLDGYDPDWEAHCIEAVRLANAKRRK